VGVGTGRRGKKGQRRGPEKNPAIEPGPAAGARSVGAGESHITGTGGIRKKRRTSRIQLQRRAPWRERVSTKKKIFPYRMHLSRRAVGEKVPSLAGSSRGLPTEARRALKAGPKVSLCEKIRTTSHVWGEK